MVERIRFYFDQHIPISVAEGLQRRGADVLTAQEADRCGYTDEEQIAFAQNEKRVIVTFDDDFLRIASTGIQHTGIAFCAGTKYSIGELIHALMLLHSVLEPNDMHNHIEFL